MNRTDFARVPRHPGVLFSGLQSAIGTFQGHAKSLDGRRCPSQLVYWKGRDQCLGERTGGESRSKGLWIQGRKSRERAQGIVIEQV